MLISLKDENGEMLTDTEIKDEALNFMLAGHDTNASGLLYVLYYKCIEISDKQNDLYMHTFLESPLSKDSHVQN